MENDAGYISHVKRGFNKAADTLANKAMDNEKTWREVKFCEKGFEWMFQNLAEQSDCHIHARFDGGYRKEENRAGAGVRIQICQSNYAATIAFDLVTIAENVPAVDSFQSELFAANLAVEYLKIIAIKLLTFNVDQDIDKVLLDN